jgi:RNA polymerase sigma-70 factor (ECF subfamily)
LTLWRKRAASASETRPGDARLRVFEETFLPHMNAAHDLARWLTRSDQDAQDVVQESYLRAFRFFEGWQGGDGKAWLLTIVRNTSRSWHERRSRDADAVPFDETLHAGAASHERSVADRLADRDDMRVLKTCIENLPVEFREVLVLRELEEMSYREIADATGLAMGTVMSRLSRARRSLAECAAGKGAR